MTINLYTHGPTQCRKCLPETALTAAMGDWRLQNNPGYYGSSNPEILILGFSKGANQVKVADCGDFDRVAFANARHRLQQVLEVLGIMPTDRSIDDIMTAREPQFGTASLVRCSLAKLKAGTYRTSGDVIPSAFATKATALVIRTCAETHLQTLPSATRLVLLLGTADAYITKTQALLRSIHSDFRQVNQVAFEAAGALWLYAAHPSPGNGHFSDWISAGAENPSGRKRLLAAAAIARSSRYSNTLATESDEAQIHLAPR